MTSLLFGSLPEGIPGLVIESDSLDALIERVRFAAPELLALNGATQETCSMCFRSERRENEILKQGGIGHLF
jgi:hypothetical protein